MRLVTYDAGEGARAGELRGDTIFDSAALVDAAAVGQDPPLYFLRRGDSLVRNGADPLLRLQNATQTFDSLMVVCCSTASVSRFSASARRFSRS